MKRPGRLLAKILLGALPAALPTPAIAQEKQFERAFSAGTVSSYRVTLSVRIEVQGQEVSQVGAKAYAKPFSRSATVRLTWQDKLSVVSLAAEGVAEIEETLDRFESSQTAGPETDDSAQKLLQVTAESLRRWPAEVPLTLHYRESPSGKLQDLKPDGVPPLEEADPPLLALWLLRALRPEPALPAAPMRFGAPWQEPRAAKLPNWADVRGSEFGEWLRARGAEPAARLHVVQEISGTVVSGTEKPPEGTAQARFHGESLDSISLLDGHLLAASRSAVREVTWTLAPVEGLPDRPQFRGRLSVEVSIEALQ